MGVYEANTCGGTTAPGWERTFGTALIGQQKSIQQYRGRPRAFPAGRASQSRAVRARKKVKCSIRFGALVHF